MGYARRSVVPYNTGHDHRPTLFPRALGPANGHCRTYRRQDVHRAPISKARLSDELWAVKSKLRRMGVDMG